MDVEVVYWYLRHHNLFEQMSDIEYKDLCVISGYKTARKNEVIYMTHETVKRIYFLKKGVVKIASVDENGNEITKDVIQQGDIFGEITLNEKTGNNSEFAKAISDEVSICSFKLDDFEQLLKKIRIYLCVTLRKLVINLKQWKIAFQILFLKMYALDWLNF